MKKILVILTLPLLTACASNSAQLYYDTAKAVSKDNTVAQTACYSAILEIARGGDNTAKVGAITLAEKCKTPPMNIEPPKKNWFGF